MPGNQHRSITRGEKGGLAFPTKHFGKAGAHFHAFARGEDHRPVLPDRPRKSAGSETTYPKDLETTGEIETAIGALADEVWAWCERTRSFGRTVTVKLRYADFRTPTRSRSSTSPVANRAALTTTAIALVRGLFPLAKPVRLLGVTVSGFDGRRTSDGQPALDLAILPSRTRSASDPGSPSVAGVVALRPGRHDPAAAPRSCASTPPHRAVPARCARSVPVRLRRG